MTGASPAMDSQYAFGSISESDFEDILSQYPDAVPSKLADLEKQRLSIIPAVLAGRRSEGQAYLTKAEVATLVDWKLSHGTFRPSLKGLVQQNSEEFVEETTIAGFSAKSWNDSLNILTKLKGIGPATAALLLSTSNPAELPFFSDEIFRWAFWQNKTGDRWDRKIKYSLKEYRELKAKIDELRGRIGREAIEIERVAYVLGKREVDLGAPATADQIHQEAEADDTLPDEKAPGRDKANPTRSKRAPAQDETQNEDAKPEQPKKRQKTAAPSASQRVTRSSGKANTGAS